MRIERNEDRYLVVRPGFPEGRCLVGLAERCGFRVCQICHELGCSPAHFRRVFARDAGVSPKRWLEELRLIRAQECLEAGATTWEVALRLGFSCHASLRRAMGPHLPAIFMQAEVPVDSNSADSGHCNREAWKAVRGFQELEISGACQRAAGG